MSPLITSKQLAWVDGDQVAGLPSFVQQFIQEKKTTDQKCYLLVTAMAASHAVFGYKSWPALIISTLCVAAFYITPDPHKIVSLNEVLSDMHRPDVNERTLRKVLKRFGPYDAYSRSHFIKDIYKLYAQKSQLTPHQTKVVVAFKKEFIKLITTCSFCGSPFTNLDLFLNILAPFLSVDNKVEIAKLNGRSIQQFPLRKEYARVYLQHLVNASLDFENIVLEPEQCSQLARKPYRIGDLIHIDPEILPLKTCLSISKMMSPKEQSSFLWGLPNLSQSSMIDEIVISLLPSRGGLERNEHDIIRPLTKWPKLLANHYFSSDLFAKMPDGFLEMMVDNFFSRFLEWKNATIILTEKMSEPNKEIFHREAAKCLEQNSNEIYRFIRTDHWSWLKGILLFAPKTLAECSHHFQREATALKKRKEYIYDDLINPESKNVTEQRQDSIIQELEEIRIKMDLAEQEIFSQNFLMLVLKDCEAEVLKFNEKTTPELFQEFLTCIHFLNNNPLFVQQNPSLAKRFFELFAKVDSSELVLLRQIMDQHNDLLPSSSVECNGLITTIPQLGLVTLSPVFERMIAYQKNTTTVLKLNSEGLELLSVSAFLQYLFNHKISADEEHLLSLLYLAQMYQIGHLSSLCLQQIESNLDEENLRVVLPAAIEMKLFDLCCICFQYIKKRPSLLDKLLKEEGLEPDTKEFLCCVNLCNFANINITYRPGQREVIQSDQYGTYQTTTMGTRTVEASIQITKDIHQTVTDFFYPTHRPMS